jgi:hypothetical protein
VDSRVRERREGKERWGKVSEEVSASRTMWWWRRSKGEGRKFFRVS